MNFNKKTINFSWIFLIVTLFFWTNPLQAELVKALRCVLTDNTEELIPVYQEAVIVPEGDNLNITSIIGDFTIPISQIKFFKEGEMDIDLSIIEGNTPDASLGELDFDLPASWSIYSIDGFLIAKGSEYPDFNILKKGQLYIIKQGNLTYKFLKR